MSQGEEILSPAPIHRASKEPAPKKKIRQQLYDVRYSLVTILLGIIVITISATFGFSGDTHDFTFQKILFSTLAAMALVLGLNVGYLYPNYKTIWVGADIVWIFTAVFALAGVLSPVEAYVLKGKEHVAITSAESSRKAIIQKLAETTRSTCDEPIHAVDCPLWKALQRRVDVESLNAEDTLARLETGLPAAREFMFTAKDRNEISAQVKSLDESVATQRKAHSDLETVNIGWAYSKLAILILAGGARAGKTGADFRKARDETPKTEANNKENAWRRFWLRIKARSQSRNS